jgi:hypothetical protein
MKKQRVKRAIKICKFSRTIPCFLLLCLAAACCGDSASRGTKRPDKHFTIDLQRHSVRFETAAVTLLSPGPLKKWPQTMSMEESSFILNSETFIYSHLPEVQVVVCWIRNREGFNVDLYGGVEGLMLATQQDEGVIGLEYHTRDTTVSGLPAVRASVNYRQFGDRASELVIFGKNNEAWLVNVYVSLEDKDIARRIVESVYVRAQVAGQPDTPPQEVERLKIKVTLDGKIHLNGKEASFEEVKQELERLREVNGVVLYYREGGKSPPGKAESVSAAILFEIGKAGLAFVWSKEVIK